MFFSVGVLYSSHEFLDKVAKGIINDVSFPGMWNKRYLVADSKSIFEAALKCEWISISNAKIELTPRGQEIVDVSDTTQKLRMQLVDLLRYFKPSWAAAIPYGRNEAFRFMPAEIQQCFVEADLINNYDQTTILWWDKLSNTIRGYNDDEKLKLGRTGERLTIEYEKHRTNNPPKWVSIDSNLSGYDVLSVVSDIDSSPLAIEVKTCTVEDKHFFITRNEWSNCEYINNYLFYVWTINKRNKSELIIFTKEQVWEHIPNDNGDGKWQSVEITIR